MVQHVPPGLPAEIIGVDLPQVCRRQVPCQGEDLRGVARKAAVAAHAVTFQGDPVRPEIAEIRHRHHDAARPGGGDRDAVVGALLAQQDEVRDPLRV